MKGRNAKLLRKTHRYLGLSIGIQFVLWTIGGLYFSWTDLDEIHGDHFKNSSVRATSFTSLLSPTELGISPGVQSIELLEIAGRPHYWINEKKLVDAESGQHLNKVSEDQAREVVKRHMDAQLKIRDVELVESVGVHHEFRERDLPVYAFSLDHKSNVTAYVSARNGRFETVRHRGWRIFDWLWMAHTMDYQTRDNFNNWLLRSFSLLAFITVISGFVLWMISSPTVRRFRRIRYEA